MTALSACPACDAAPLAREIATRGQAVKGTVLSLPAIHCAACIRGVETALTAHPQVRGARVNLSRKRVSVDAPALSPEELVALLARAGFEALPMDAALLVASDADPAGRALLLRVAVAGFAMMNVMLFSVAVWSGASQATQVMFHWLSAAIAVPALFFSAEVFARSAWGALSAGRLNMDVPITLAIVLAAAMSVLETAQGGHHVYFDAALSLTFFLLAGRYLDHRTRVAARSASEELSALECPRATRLTAGRAEVVDVAALRPGDLVQVAMGMRIPVDGVVVQGASDLDRALLTGESQPQPAGPGARIEAGALNLTAPLVIEVTATGEDTTLRRMAALIETAEGARNRYTALADRAAAIYAPAVHLLALVTFAAWMALGAGWQPALNIAISVLIITCPCALGLAVPAVMTAATGRFFRHGMLVKDGTALERLAGVDTVVFDKTGTLTTGHARLDATSLDADALSVLAGLAGASSHPVARALAAALPEGTTATALSDITEHPGRGVQAIWQGQVVRLGHGDWVGAASSPALSIGAGTSHCLTFRETLRDGAAESVAALRAMGLGVEILSGDAPAPVAAIAAALGDVPAAAGLSPQEKIAALSKLAEQGHRVLMVGDGLNDTGALAAAYASMSPASALDAARTASDIVLLDQSLHHIPLALDTARRARARVLENFAIAAGYNMIAIPVAVLGFATPLSAAIAMSASSITVLLNALRVR